MNKYQNTTTYDKLQKYLTDEMEKFTKNKCLLVKKKIGDTNFKEGMCHLNVEQQVKEYGGKKQSAWVLNRVRGLMNIEIWLWSFHSLWINEQNKIYDITNNKINNGEYSTVYLENERHADLENGVMYNDLAIVNNTKFATEMELECKKLYWSAMTLSIFKEINSSDGIYRCLGKNYLKNIEILNEKYGVFMENEKLTSIDGNTYASNDMLFEFNLKIA